MYIIRIYIVTLILATLMLPVYGQKSISELSDGERQQVNEWFTLRTKLMLESSHLAEELETIWQNPKFTSPEVEKLRKEYSELEKKLTALQQELRVKIKEIPAVKAKFTALDNAKRRVEELTEQIQQKVKLPQ